MKLSELVDTLPDATKRMLCAIAPTEPASSSVAALPRLKSPDREMPLLELIAVGAAIKKRGVGPYQRMPDSLEGLLRAFEDAIDWAKWRLEISGDSLTFLAIQRALERGMKQEDGSEERLAADIYGNTLICAGYKSGSPQFIWAYSEIRVAWARVQILRQAGPAFKTGNKIRKARKEQTPEGGSKEIKAERLMREIKIFFSGKPLPRMKNGAVHKERALRMFHDEAPRAWLGVVESYPKPETFGRWIREYGPGDFFNQILDAEARSKKAAPTQNGTT
ncbi:MAG: hypothetical protein MRY74_14490 [Neomegalonema sp.]|nr:hypothetical protein [Neomegalonema sp.]